MQTTTLLIEQANERPLALRLTASAEGLTMIDCLDALPPEQLSEEESGVNHPILEQAARELSEYFARRRLEFTVPIDLQQGTEFQREVWAELRRIPYGKTISYGQQAKNIGRPNAVRAVGGANGRNPLPIVIPCHRVLSAAGKLHGFSSGLDLKRRLLAIEGLDIRK
jgi:methylated-DNA-[protein]-cysteine S-methyltransferase